MKYNATVYSKRNGEEWGTFVAHVEKIGNHLMMLRSNSVQCTGFEDKVVVLNDTPENRKMYDGQLECALYDLYLRMRHPNIEYTIVMDDCAGYKNKLTGMNLPPAYLTA